MFQAMMNDMSRPFMHRCVLVFFDDILICSRPWTEHIQHICVMFSVLPEHGLILKRSRCLFGERGIHHLGHVITNDAVAMD
jgi:hypothetical protein